MNSKPSPSPLPAVLAQKTTALLDAIRGYGRCAIAYSGGVDSAVVAKAAVLALDGDCIAITGSSHSLAQGELEQAAETARLIGIPQEVIQTDEFSNNDYVRNAPDRCFHCKSELYSQLDRIAPTLNVSVILNGANTDDLGDYRPGLQAAADYQVRSPLADCGFNKADVRALAEHWQLPVWDKPATPCLSSRVAYGQAVTPERLRMIDNAERLLRSNGFEICRVRYHEGDLARIEVQTDDLPRLLGDPLNTTVKQALLDLGFRFVTVDLGGFRSGSLNAAINDSQREPKGQFVPVDSIGMPNHTGTE